MPSMYTRKYKALLFLSISAAFLPVYIVFVIMIYRLPKAAFTVSAGRHSCSCGEWDVATGPASPAGLAGVISILQSCNMPANEPQNGSRTTPVLEPVGPVLAAAHHQLYLLL